MKIYIYLAAAIAIISMLSGGAWFIYEAGKDSIRSDMAEVVSIEVAKARKDEKLKQDKVNAIIQKQYDDLNTINSNLTTSLDRLRKRTSRKDVSRDTQANCKGTTGAELSSEDGGFLVREASRADRLRTALKACYNYADSIQ